ERIPSLPDVPTMSELKQPEVDISPFTAILAPQAVPEHVVERLAQASHAALNDAAVRKRVEDMGGVPSYMDGDQFEQFLDRQVETYHGLIQSGLLKVN